MTLRSGFVLAAVLGATVIPSRAQQNPAQSQQPAPTGSGAITGTVVDGQTGDPVAGALVFLAPVTPGASVPLAQTRQITDARGRFAFVELTGDGAFTISASKFGYLDGGYGRDHSATDPLRAVALKKDDWVSGLRVSIFR